MISTNIRFEVKVKVQADNVIVCTSGVLVCHGRAEALDRSFHVCADFFVDGTGYCTGFKVECLGLYGWNGGGEVEEGEEHVKEDDEGHDLVRLLFHGDLWG